MKTQNSILSLHNFIDFHCFHVLHLWFNGSISEWAQEQFFKGSGTVLVSDFSTNIVIYGRGCPYFYPSLFNIIQPIQALRRYGVPISKVESQLDSANSVNQKEPKPNSVGCDLQRRLEFQAYVDPSKLVMVGNMDGQSRQSPSYQPVTTAA